MGFPPRLSHIHIDYHLTAWWSSSYYIVLAPWPPMGVLSMGFEHYHRGNTLTWSCRVVPKDVLHVILPIVSISRKSVLKTLICRQKLDPILTPSSCSQADNWVLEIRIISYYNLILTFTHTNWLGLSYYSMKSQVTCYYLRSAAQNVLQAFSALPDISRSLPDMSCIFPDHWTHK